MKNLELNQMENFTAGHGPDPECFGFAVGMAAAFTFATIATGGAFAIFAIGAIGSLSAGAFC